MVLNLPSSCLNLLRAKATGMSFQQELCSRVWAGDLLSSGWTSHPDDQWPWLGPSLFHQVDSERTWKVPLHDTITQAERPRPRKHKGQSQNWARIQVTNIQMLLSSYTPPQYTTVPSYCMHCPSIPLHLILCAPPQYMTVAPTVCTNTLYHCSSYLCSFIVSLSLPVLHFKSQHHSIIKTKDGTNKQNVS